ncbi:hypothetical protein FSY45_06665 [Comamonas sp. Z1]|nr:hypothetical protein FSY45_06665 [Comamonas sp. Z1]
MAGGCAGGRGAAAHAARCLSDASAGDTQAQVARRGKAMVKPLPATLACAARRQYYWRNELLAQ